MKHLIILLLVAVAAGCAGHREIKEKDPLGRETRVAYYDGSNLEYLREIEYQGRSYNPQRIVYKKLADSTLVTVKEEKIEYSGHTPVRHSFHVYREGESQLKGYIQYRYSGEFVVRAEYYAVRTKSEPVMCGLSVFTYKGNSLNTRRMIQFRYDGDINKAVQKAQHVVYYDKGEVMRMRSWVIDGKAEKVVEKKMDDKEAIIESIKTLEEEFVGCAKNGFALE